MMYSSFAAPPFCYPLPRGRTEWAGFYSLTSRLMNEKQLCLK